MLVMFSMLLVMFGNDVPYSKAILTPDCLRCTSTYSHGVYV